MTLKKENEQTKEDEDFGEFFSQFLKEQAKKLKKFNS